MISPAAFSDLGSLLEEATRRFQGRVALVEMERKKERLQLRYEEIPGAAAAVQHLLAERGIARGSRVAVLMSNQSRWLLAAYAIFQRGAVLVPLDYKLGPEDQRKLLAHSGATLLITEEAIWRRLLSSEGSPLPFAIVSESPRPLSATEGLRWEDLSPPPAGAATRPELPTRDEVATIVYSSGTGGSPKGCMLTHGSYLAQLELLTRLYPMVEGDRYFSLLPTNHAIDFMCGFIGPLSGGATVVHQRTLRPEFILATLQAQKITHMALVPLLLAAFERSIRERLDALPPWQRRLFERLRRGHARLVREAPRPALSRKLFARIHEAFGGELRFLFCGGAFVDPERAQFFYDLGLPVAIGYGLTEACTVISVNDLRPFRADSVGKVLPGVDLEIRELEPSSGVGEIWVRGPTLMKGYLDDPEQSAEVLQGGWLRTGDLGYLDGEGHLHLVGRRKNMIVTTGGKNVYPEDIESAFEGAPCEELAVFADAYLWSEHKLGHESLVIVARGASDAAIDEIRRRNQRLPDFKRVQTLLRWEEPFPRTASLKLKREALASEVRRQRASLPDLVTL